MSERRIPYIWEVTENVPDVRYPEPPIADVPPNPERKLEPQNIIAFRTPSEYLRLFGSCIESGADVLYRDNYDLAERVKQAWYMATEYPLPIDNPGCSDSVRQTIRSEIQRLIERLTTGGPETIFPELPVIAPEPTEEDEYKRLCAAVQLFVASALQSISDSVSDVAEIPAKVAPFVRKLGAKGFVASVLVQLADEAIEALINAAIANETNIEELTCLVLSNISGQATTSAQFGTAFDRSPYPDPILEIIRAALSLWDNTPGAYAAWLDAWRQVSDAPLATLPECPCVQGQVTIKMRGTRYRVNSEAWVTLTYETFGVDVSFVPPSYPFTLTLEDAISGGYIVLGECGNADALQIEAESAELLYRYPLACTYELLQPDTIGTGRRFDRDGSTDTAIFTIHNIF